ncbi:alpha/beta hydrolase [Flexivirga meconopsidis]|uniref:alpha/beta hydrolase n=1 Tax=Flexivirga meconopsidis TaxID=2977121 RepID=UPI00223F605C|nr:alpha/beta hydrolase [Flexivirga meconopsidis]
MTARRYYRDERAWRDQQEFLPERLRLTDETAPEEEHWDWFGHQVHLDRYRNPAGQARVVLHHGVGTNGRQMSLILGRPLAERGYDVVAPDNLGYGMTTVAKGRTPSYDDWVQLMVDFLEAENSRDPKPTVFYGLSAGGMLGYHVAAAAPADSLRGLVGMTFLDQRFQQVRDETAHDIVSSRLGVPMLRMSARTPMAKMKYPMTLASKMTALVNDRAALKTFLRDRSSAGNWVSIKFLASYLDYQPAVEPAAFDACPILLTQPQNDRWSPRELSRPVLDRITQVAVDEVTLPGAGHYPLEDAGLRELVDSVDDFAQVVLS